MDCQICATEINASTRARVPCFACPLVVCKTCVREYIRTTPSLPKCMGCGAAFQLNYLVTHLNRSWVNDGLKPVMKETLVTAELAKMPATLPFAEAEMERRRLSKINTDYQARINKLQTQMTRYTNAIFANRYRMRGEAVPPRFLNDLVREDNGGAAVREDTKKKFIMACPNGGCKGFLSTAYKCALCEKFTCPDCLVILQGGEHVCVESDKLSADLIKKETRPCPTCGERIFKVNGCDQMFCTAVNDGARCATVFDWKTGAVQVGGTVHNPHFYELGRANGELVRNVGDVQCGGLPDIRRLVAILERLGALPLRHRAFVTYQRLAEHARVLDVYRGRLRVTGDLRQLRVMYLLKDITLDELRDRVFKDHREHGKTVDLYHVSELANVSGIEAYIEICRGLPSIATLEQLLVATPEVGGEIIASVENRLNELDRIRLYCNDQLKQISITYSCTVHVFQSDFAPQSRKFNIKA
jgi:hypothetical protein